MSAEIHMMQLFDFYLTFTDTNCRTESKRDKLQSQLTVNELQLAIIRTLKMVKRTRSIMWPIKMDIVPLVHICRFNHCRRSNKTLAIHRRHQHHLDHRIHPQRHHHSVHSIRLQRPHHSDRLIHLQRHSFHRSHRLHQYQSYLRRHIQSMADHHRHQFMCHRPHHSIGQVNNDKLNRFK